MAISWGIYRVGRERFITLCPPCASIRENKGESIALVRADKTDYSCRDCKVPIFAPIPQWVGEP